MSRRVAASAVHPRSRGEHTRAAARMSRTSGPSPLTRGTQRDAHDHGGLPRSIPAHAGNTPRTTRPPARFHGPSPLTRGTRGGSCCVSLAGRSIPAHAGNTPARCRWPRSRSVHPRSRGEHESWWSGTAPASVHPRSRGEHANSRMMRARSAGPSPLTRGTLLRGGMSYFGDRSIPLTRGTPGDPAAVARYRRSIPAHAGNTA